MDSWALPNTGYHGSSDVSNNRGGIGNCHPDYAAPQQTGYPAQFYAHQQPQYQQAQQQNCCAERQRSQRQFYGVDPPSPNQQTFYHLPQPQQQQIYIIQQSQPLYEVHTPQNQYYLVGNGHSALSPPPISSSSTIQPPENQQPVYYQGVAQPTLGHMPPHHQHLLQQQQQQENNYAESASSTDVGTPRTMAGGIEHHYAEAAAPGPNSSSRAHDGGCQALGIASLPALHQSFGANCGLRGDNDTTERWWAPTADPIYHNPNNATAAHATMWN